MKIKEIIVETYNQNEIDELSKLIAKYCQPYLNANKLNYPLYRGIIDTVQSMPGIQNVSKINTRSNRKPLDTPLNDQIAVDDYFEANFGYRYRCDHIAFCTGFKHRASVYGKAHIIIPIGEFSFLWSKTIYDLTDFLPNRQNFPLGSNERKKQISIILDNGNYQNTDLTTAISANSEIMLRCRGYFALVEEAFDQYDYDYILDKARDMF